MDGKEQIRHHIKRSERELSTFDKAGETTSVSASHRLCNDAFQSVRDALTTTASTRHTHTLLSVAAPDLTGAATAHNGHYPAV